MAWLFSTTDFDIGFRWEFQSTADIVLPASYVNPQVELASQLTFLASLIPFPQQPQFKRVACHRNPIQGEIVAPSPGKLLLSFDNSYSKWSAKELRLHVTVTLPEADDPGDDEMRHLFERDAAAAARAAAFEPPVFK